MGERTGKPRGRPTGAKNKLTEEREARIAEAAAAVEEALPEAFHGDSHALLMLVYKNKDLAIALRLDAAKAAIGYEKPRLAQIQANITGELDIRSWMVAATGDEDE